MAKKKPRRRPLPEAVIARNLAYEKRRREELNDQFLELARLIPALASAQRISKGLIVTESVRRLRQQQVLCIAAARDVQSLLDENRQMAGELNFLRLQVAAGSAAGDALLPTTVDPVQPRPPTEALMRLMDVVREVYGEFPDGLGGSLGSRPSALRFKCEQRTAGHELELACAPAQQDSSPLGGSDDALGRLSVFPDPEQLQPARIPQAQQFQQIQQQTQQLQQLHQIPLNAPSGPVVPFATLEKPLLFLDPTRLTSSGGTTAGFSNIQGDSSDPQYALPIHPPIYPGISGAIGDWPLESPTAIPDQSDLY